MKSLRRVEFVLVATQTIIDLLFSGFAAFRYHRPRLWNYFFNMCSEFEAVKSHIDTGETGKQISANKLGRNVLKKKLF